MENDREEAPSAADGIDPTVAAVLASLWHAAQSSPPEQGPLARISKHTGLAMSTLKRTLAMLEDAGLVQVLEDDRGRTLAQLTAHGLGVCAEVFASAGDQRAVEATNCPTSLSADSVPGDEA